MHQWKSASMLGLGILIFIVGSAFRFIYNDGAYVHYDEPITTGVEKTMRQTGRWDTNWDHCAVPPEFKYPQFNFSSFHVALYLTRVVLDRIPFEKVTTSWDARDGLIGFRFFSAFFASLELLAVIWLARLAALPGWAKLLCIALASVGPILIQDAHYGRPEAFVTALLLLVVIGAWPHDRPLWPAIALSAFGCGFLIASKVSFLSLAWLPTIPILATWRYDKERVTRDVLILAAVGALVALGFFVGAPGAVLAPRQFLFGFRLLQVQYAGGNPPFGHKEGFAVWDLMQAYFAGTFGWATLLLGLVGIASLLLKRRYAIAAVLAGPVVITLFIFGRQKVFFERNLSHVVPLGILLAVIGASWLINQIPREWLRRLTVAIIATITLWHPVSVSKRLLFRCFSGASDREVSAQIAAVERDYQGCTWVTSVGSRWKDQVSEELRRRLRDSPARPVLLHTITFGDPWTKESEEAICAKFELTELATHPSDFPDLPTTTLQVYSSPWHRLWLVRGAR